MMVQGIRLVTSVPHGRNHGPSPLILSAYPDAVPTLKRRPLRSTS